MCYSKCHVHFLEATIIALSMKLGQKPAGNTRIQTERIFTRSQILLYRILPFALLLIILLRK